MIKNEKGYSGSNFLGSVIVGVIGALVGAVFGAVVAAIFGIDVGRAALGCAVFVGVGAFIFGPSLND